MDLELDLHSPTDHGEPGETVIDVDEPEPNKEPLAPPILELPLLLVANLLLSLCRWIPTRLLSMKGWMLKTLSLIVVVLNSRKLCPLVPFEIDLLITDLLDPIAPASSSTAEAVPSAPQNDDLKEILDEALMVEDLDPEKNLSNWWEVKSG